MTTMIDFISRPELEKYIRSFKKDTTLFMEGDTSQDLYLLVSGKVELLKGDKKISEIKDAGSLFGEMSFLLRESRSATVKANTDVEAVVIPSTEVSAFLEEFPVVAPEITRLLARRLLETTKVVHCYKEFCDQLPDAVIMTDKDLNILAWNAAAEKLYGRSWNQMQNKPISEIYDSQAVFQQFIEELKVQKSVRERPLKITHPLENWRFVSTSTTALYDGRQNIDGYIFLGRDATSAFQLEKKQHRLKNWLFPTAAAIMLLMVFLFWSMPDYFKGQNLLEQRKNTFADRLANDYPSLSLSLADLVAEGNLAETTHIMENYFTSGLPSQHGIKGLVLLDTDKNVINAYSIKPDENTTNILGSSYADLTFNGTQGSIHNIISSVHSKGGTKEEDIELAFKMNRQGDFLGWLVFQLDMPQLHHDFGLRPEDMKSLQLLRTSS